MNKPQPKAIMIETAQAYKVGDNTFLSLKEAQIHAIIQLLFPSSDLNTGAQAAIEEIVSQKEIVIPILSLSEPSPKTRKPRSDQGKPHRKKKAAATEPAPIESTVEGSGKYAGK